MRRLVAAQRELHGGGETSQSDWSEEEEEDADAEGESLPDGPQLVGPHVHDAGHEALDDAELAVNADRLMEQVKAFQLFVASIELHIELRPTSFSK